MKESEGRREEEKERQRERTESLFKKFVKGERKKKEWSFKKDMGDESFFFFFKEVLLLLLCHFSRARLCVTP